MTTVEQVTPSGSVALEPSPGIHAVNPVRRGPLLVAMHGRTSSPGAIVTAQLLATRLGLEVQIVSVAPAEQVYPAPLDILRDYGGVSADEFHTNEIREAIRQALSIDQKWPITLRHGRVAHEVTRVARALDASLIIVNSTPATGILRTMAGTLAAELARRSPCPVLAVTDPPTSLPRRIIAAMDFSAASIHAVQAALLLADAHAALTLVHAPLPLQFDQERVKRTGAPIGPDAPTLFPRVEAEIRRYAPTSITIQHTLADGNPSSAVLDQARRQGADLIVAGTHGLNRFELFFVGSTAVSLLHHAPCAVLIAPVPPPPERIRLELGMSDVSMWDEPGEWADVLLDVVSRNRGRFVTLDVSGVLSAHADHFILRDLAWDAVDRCVEIRILDTADGRCGITRTIGHPASIIVTRAPDGRERALEVVQDRGHTQLLFLPDATN
jgi:nucleotide-binding universal stress UspA family protein